jgi:hypothetical protein
MDRVAAVALLLAMAAVRRLAAAMHPLLVVLVPLV